MTLKELIDISESTLVISEGGYSYPFIVLRELDSYSSEDFKDVLTADMMSRKIDVIKVESNWICVNLEEVER